MKLIVITTVMMLTTHAAAQTRRSGPTPPPIVQMPPPVVYAPAAPSERCGDWSVLRSGSGLLASTKNASGSAMGISCDARCVVFVNPQIRCEKGEIYPALASTPGGSFPMSLRCAPVEDRYLMTGTIDSKLLDAMEIGGEMAIAFPMEGSKFQVARFSLGRVDKRDS